MDSGAGEGARDSGADGFILRALLCLVVAALLLWGVLEIFGSGPEKPNLIVITLDTTRADRIGCYGYEQAFTPNLDRLAREGVLFENARAQVPITLPSHASIMTGTNPNWHGLDSNNQKLMDSGVNTLAESVRDQGYRTGAVIGSFVLAKAYGLAQGFDVYNDAMPVGRSGSVAPEITAHEGVERSVEWIGENRDRRFFLWWHIFDPHFPYRPSDPYASRFRGSPYDGEIASLDAAIGRLLSSLDGMGLTGKTVIAVIGDHGESLGDHGEPTHGLYVYNSTLHVPFLLRGPGIPGGKRISRLVRSIDLAPTLLDLLGCGADAQHQGRSLVALFSGEEKKETPPSYFESRELSRSFGLASLQGVERDGVKYIHQPIPELYLLDSDPGEGNNVAAGEEELKIKMRRLMEDIVVETASRTTRKEPFFGDPGDVEKFLQMGYVTGGRGKPLPGGEDHKAHRSFIEKYWKMSRAQQLKKWPLARSLLDEMLAERPGSPLCHFFMGRQLYISGEYESAIEHLIIASRHDQYKLTCFTFLGILCAELGRFDEAKKYCELALKVNPCSVDVYSNLMQIASEEGDRKGMVEYAGKILSLAPDHPSAERCRRIREEAGEGR